MSDQQYDLIATIQKLSSRIEKERHLKGVDPKILYHTYSPAKRYFISAPNVRGRGIREFDELTWRTLAVLSSRAISGHRAKEVVDSYLFHLTPKSADLFKRILNKDLRAGVGPKTINRLFPGLIEQEAVMLAEPFQASRVKYPCWVNPKVDGNRATYDRGRFFSRGGKKILGLEWMAEGLKKMGVKELDGELRDSTASFQKSSGRVRSKEGLMRNMEYLVFDLPDEEGSANERFAKLDFMSFPDGVKYLKHELAYSLDMIQSFYRGARMMGFEGLMVKSYGHLYKAGKSFEWMKIKNEDAVDCEVTKLIRGTGKYSNSLGAVEVLYNGEIVKVTPAIPDTMRQYYWDHPEKLMGATVEVTFQEETDDGSLRHPRFKKVRVDK